MTTSNRAAAERAARKIADKYFMSAHSDPFKTLEQSRRTAAELADIIEAELDGPHCIKCKHSIENVDQEGMCHAAVWPEGNAPRQAGYPCGCHCEFPAPSTPSTPCANCGHSDLHDGPAGTVDDKCTHEGCICGYFQPVPAPATPSVPEDEAVAAANQIVNKWIASLEFPYIPDAEAIDLAKRIAAALRSERAAVLAYIEGQQRALVPGRAAWGVLERIKAEIATGKHLITTEEGVSGQYVDGTDQWEPNAAPTEGGEK